MEEAVCIICNEKTDNLCNIKSRGLERLVESSKKRNDNKYKKFEKATSAFIHKNCQSSYNNETMINSARASKQRKSVESRAISKSALTFDFENNCFFCGGSCSRCNKEQVRVVTNEKTRTNVIEIIENRKSSDNLSKSILARLKSVSDLVGLKAQYHSACCANFYTERATTNIGRPASENTKNFIEFVINYIEKNKSECQFSLNEIKEGFTGDIPDLITVKSKLQEHSNSIVCFIFKKDMLILNSCQASKQICKEWYEERFKDPEDERNRIVQKAANIVLEDIRSQYYDNTQYVIPNFNEDNIFDKVPDTLKIFLDTVIKTHKEKSKKNIIKLDKQIATISHCVISAVRPRSFLSPILIGLAAMIHKKYAAKELIEALSNLSMCSSYKETLRFEASIIKDPASKTWTEDSYLQFIYDNADHNSCTIDGKNTFHAMGGIMVATPSASVTSVKTIPRLNIIPSAEEIGKTGFIKLLNFEKKNSDGLKAVIVENIYENDIDDPYETSSQDFMWLYSKNSDKKSKGWNGFMEIYYDHSSFSTSKVIPIPFINNPPSNYNTIFTTLVESARRCQAQKQNFCFVTFDQPLYYKAREIIACVDPNNDPENLSSVIVRLGGFHLLMSFLGGIGTIYAGSGLKEAFCELYAELSSEKALTGHAYARAIRGHTLIHLALSEIIFSTLELSDTEKGKLDALLLNLGTDDFKKKLKEEEFEVMKKKFIDCINDLKKKGPTAALWIQYWEMVSLVKDFIRSERSADWNLHLACIKKMLPYFHASGHNLYAKSAHLYWQDMKKINEKISDAYELAQLTSDGYFTIRRTHKFWSGVWSDMTIEQVLMRSMKSQGGLTHGRGLSDSVLAKFVLTTLTLLDVSNNMEEFCNVTFTTAEQHVDSREYRITRDVADLEKLNIFFKNYDPFPETEKLKSIFSGIIGTDAVNCHQAYEEGKKSLISMIGKQFGLLKFQRKSKVLSLKTVQSSIKVNGEIIAIDPLLLFQRISLNINCKDDMKKYLEFELAPFPLALFTENGLRKNVKSQLYDEFNSIDTLPTSNIVHVVDGGFLLHKVVWNKNDTVEQIVNKYLQYVKNHYAADSHIIFDGYPHADTTSTSITSYTTSTKETERLRRKNQTNIPTFEYQNHTKIPFLQDKFLSNDKNKNKLIGTLSEIFQKEGFICKQAQEDADSLIIHTSIEVSVSTGKTVIVVGQDIDLLVLLTQLNSDDLDIYFHKPGSGNVKDYFYTSNSFKHVAYKDKIAFIHSFTGCDTTSAFAGKGKKMTVKSLLANKNLSTLAEVFYQKNAEKKTIAEHGLKLIGSIYKSKKNIDLNELRFENYRAATGKSSFKLEKLPPTKDAAIQHCYRAYFQLQSWLGNELLVTDWGWKPYMDRIMPTFTEKDLIPESLLKTIHCSCEKGCDDRRCSCRKHGLKCTNLCTNCHSSESCSNVDEQFIEGINSEEIEEEELRSIESRCESEEFDDEEDELSSKTQVYYETDEDIPAKKQKLS